MNTLWKIRTTMHRAGFHILFSPYRAYGYPQTYDNKFTYNESIEGLTVADAIAESDGPTIKSTVWSHDGFPGEVYRSLFPEAGFLFAKVVREDKSIVWRRYSTVTEDGKNYALGNGTFAPNLRDGTQTFGINIFRTIGGGYGCAFVVTNLNVQTATTSQWSLQVLFLHPDTNKVTKPSNVWTSPADVQISNNACSVTYDEITPFGIGWMIHTVVVNQLPKFTTYDIDYQNPNIVTTSPAINEEIPIRKTDISITYDMQVKPNAGNVSIYATDDMNILLRQTYSPVYF
ncbi:10598_t:CDS:2 [Paraglomus brasilianum]|uniref:10598_t:CDS:1 n=1 Tax=Paraglomus brasilianum TaxID=144538 RepID=A0A9N9F259_9GLOM|nr:10598_t:CDS:2 [Paraglomus brasilianum]